MKKSDFPIWRRTNGEIIACTEKIKVMQENFLELKQTIQDCFEDGLIMDVDEAQLRQELIKLINSLENPYKDNNV